MKAGYPVHKRHRKAVKNRIHPTLKKKKEKISILENIPLVTNKL